MARPAPRRSSALLFSALATLLATASPAGAIERILLRLPVLQTSFSINVSELGDPQRLLRGNSDLAQLDRASDGALGRQMLRVFREPLPLQAPAVAQKLVGTPMLNQVLLMLSTLGKVDGLPKQLDSQVIEQAFQKAAASPQGLNLVDVLKAIPGQTVSLDLDQFLRALTRLMQQQSNGVTLVQQLSAASVSAALANPGPLSVQRSEQRLVVAHRPEPLPVVVIAPVSGGNGRLVTISHGLWDAPTSFEGWGRHLASHGYTVALPRHIDSDSDQQREMLEGLAPPPTPDQLRLRPLDVSSVIDAVGDGRLKLPAPVRTDAVAALGQSWGATTVLQLAGIRPSAARLQQSCTNANDPSRNISWVLQCSFVQSADKAWVPDARVSTVAAVSPMLSLLFDQGASQGLRASVLLVSGSRDWVVPSGPEALQPVQQALAEGVQGSRLVLANGGDHFNLGATYDQGGGPLGALLLDWLRNTLGGDGTKPAGASAALQSNGWGNSTIPLVDATASLPGLRLAYKP
ncbi:MAG: alpha/beta hydrolase [Cyanobium sp.]